MAIISDALRQAFMPKHEYESLREEEKAWSRIQRPIVLVIVMILGLMVLISVTISLNIVFPSDNGNRPFCHQRVQINDNGLLGGSGESDLFPGAFYLTEQEAVDYYWMVVFIPSAIIFVVSSVYLLAGMAVAYSAPTRNGCLKVVENNYCASKRGGVRCLSILNIVFAIIFGLLAVFLGSSLLTLGSSCTLPLFWCYEIASWSLVIFYGGTAFLLRRKAATILDEGDFAGRNFGLEMLEAAPQEVTPEVERRVNEGFKTWMGSSLLSSDEEDGPDDYLEVAYPTRTNSGSRQRV
ncbi:hypothetical protein C5167_029721 [Papaver somniferum]|uniref:uncharacterized protein LOC113338072 n=1 Tax=Papaver somniferum TaxID=3469 RepID=UPI000E70005E|nr:uncharacterized protein LOC113338072 [Papaver somniferum]RZC90587.1 hypothetical protein C5167_029721 [Papaver somniferum]